MDFTALREAIYGRAAELAKTADADELVKLADAAAKVGYGPQGARTIYDYNSTSHSTYGDPRAREREAGFR